MVSALLTIIWITAAFLTGTSDSSDLLWSRGGTAGSGWTVGSWELGFFGPPAVSRWEPVISSSLIERWNLSRLGPILTGLDRHQEPRSCTLAQRQPRTLGPVPFARVRASAAPVGEAGSTSAEELVGAPGASCLVTCVQKPGSVNSARESGRSPTRNDLSST